MILPFEKPILTSPFGNRDMGGGRIEFHSGIDLIPAGSGLWNGINHNSMLSQIQKRLNTAIVSCLGGKVVFSDRLAGGGYTVVIDSVFSQEELPQTIRLSYSHLQENLQVNVGDIVDENQIIGYMGYSDVVYEQTHLHFGLCYNPILDPRFCYQESSRTNPIGNVFGYTWNVQEGCNEITL